MSGSHWCRVAVLCLITAMPSMAAEQDRLQRIYEATCRVSVPGGTGTGTVFREDDKHYYMLTNAHVVGSSRTAGVEFIKNHWPSPRLRATVTGRKLINNGSFDVAVLRIKKSLLNGVELPVIPLATADDAPAEVRLITCGCQAGEMPSLQQVLTLENSGQLIYYVPPAKPGRSGSALIDIKGERIFGLVAWETKRGGKSSGLAMTTERILPWLVNRNHAVEVSALPPDTKAIPLAPDVNTEERMMAAAQSQCDPNSPWCPDRPANPDKPAMPDVIGGSDNPWGGGGGRTKPAKPDDVSRRMKVLLDAQTTVTSSRFDTLDASAAALGDAVVDVGTVAIQVRDDMTTAIGGAVDDVKTAASEVHVHLDQISEQQKKVSGLASTAADIWQSVKTVLTWVIALLILDRILSALFSPQWPRKLIGPSLKRLLSIRMESKTALKQRLAELESQIAKESQDKAEEASAQ